MMVLDSPEQLNLKDVILCIGNFDGVHIGHQLLLGHMHKLSLATGKPGVILTFFPPAKTFFLGGEYLSTPEEKLELLGVFSPAATIMIPFTQAYATTSKEVFIEQVASLQPYLIIVGEDFRFGHQRQGSLNDLSKIPERLEVFNLRQHNGAPVSSSRIREYLKLGQIAETSKLLGRHYAATGLVLEGDKRGRSIGFPTANLLTSSGKALPLGVFAVDCKVQNRRVFGMANVGPRPTFPDDPPSLEVHLFDFDEDIYGESVTVKFIARLRSQKRFANLDELKVQLNSDRHAALTVLSTQ